LDDGGIGAVVDEDASLNDAANSGDFHGVSFRYPSVHYSLNATTRRDPCALLKEKGRPYWLIRRAD